MIHKKAIQSRALLTIVTATFFSLHVYSQTDTILSEIEIWPGVGPGSDTLTITETILERSLTGTCTRDWAITNVTIPTITPLIPVDPSGSAFIICPGGAYQRVVYDVEGMDVGRYLNSMGITAFVLKYRLPADAHIDKKNVPLQDAQRAIRYVKMHADEWGLDTTKIGIAGASAGGHLAATLATAFNKETYVLKDSVDSISARPYYMFLLYPVISMESDITHTYTRDLLLGSNPSQELIDEFSAEKHVTSQSPVSFLAHAGDDSGVSPENSRRMYNALQDSGVVSKLIIYANGGHGVGICKAGGSDFANWIYDCGEWMDSLGLGTALERPDYINPIDNNEDLFSVSPNPATQHAIIHYTVNELAPIRITMYDVMGKLVSELLNEVKKPGDYSITIDDLVIQHEGIFILRFDNGKSFNSKKIVFIRE